MDGQTDKVSYSEVVLFVIYQREEWKRKIRISKIMENHETFTYLLIEDMFILTERLTD